MVPGLLTWVTDLLQQIPGPCRMKMLPQEPAQGTGREGGSVKDLQPDAVTKQGIRTRGERPGLAVAEAEWLLAKYSHFLSSSRKRLTVLMGFTGLLWDDCLKDSELHIHGSV